VIAEATAADIRRARPLRAGDGLLTCTGCERARPEWRYERLVRNPNEAHQTVDVMKCTGCGHVSALLPLPIGPPMPPPTVSPFPRLRSKVIHRQCARVCRMAGSGSFLVQRVLQGHTWEQRPPQSATDHGPPARAQLHHPRSGSRPTAVPDRGRRLHQM
jgi:ferredoxin